MFSLCIFLVINERLIRVPELVGGVVIDAVIAVVVIVDVAVLLLVLFLVCLLYDSGVFFSMRKSSFATMISILLFSAGGGVSFSFCSDTV